MYRQYEDPRKLEKMLEDARTQLEAAKQEDPDNVDRLVDLHQEVESLKERVNFAWQDEEYDEQYASDYYPEDQWDGNWEDFYDDDDNDDETDDWRPGDAPWNAPGMSVSDFIR